MTPQSSPPASSDDLDFAGFAKLASDPSLSKYQKIGFPDSYRSGFEERIFADIRSKLRRLDETGLSVLDIGPGCSDLPFMLIELCRTQGHRLTLIDSPEMLANLPDLLFITKRPGLFPKSRAELTDLTAQVDVILCYSVFHYIFVDADAFSFIDAALALLKPGGELLIGDIPNVSKRRRFFVSPEGIAFHRQFTGTDTLPADDTSNDGKIDDSVLFALLLRARAAGADAYIVPQDPALPMANRREDILIRKP